MNYIYHTFPGYGVTAEVSSFRPRRKVAEFHIMLHTTGWATSYEQQLINLHRAFKDLLARKFPANITPVIKRYFLSDAANQTTFLEQELKTFPPCSVSIVQQPPLDGSKVALWVYLLSGVNTSDEECFTVSHNDYQHYWISSQVSPIGTSDTQTETLLCNYEQLLATRDCHIARHCIRTWFFVQNVDVNYTGVVEARKRNFLTQGLTEKTHYIASTGIEGRSSDPNSKVQFDAYAVNGIEEGQITFLYALTHLNPTYEYGVTFERGVCMQYGDRKQLYISGTASIDHKGVVLHVGDIIAQTHRMWKNVEKLLEEGEANMEDLAQIIVYLRDVADYPLVKKMFDEEFPQVPKQIVLAAVCRPSWLIEMECIAIKSDKNEKFRDL
ncbi:Rid family hydrolase [uncultured Bacteroides sp.]|uniref:Rid family hydrolase n=1 Tax=uncultured Bacteroides sp. TaxID=162156 RepID=UPI002AABFA8B|nr:Rid family hydrolase [uncultured Bacteroides sp.]